MKIVSAVQMHHIDHDAIHGYGIPGLSLMERAGAACAGEIIARYGGCKPNSAIVVAGKGNNGGDGYVIARILHSAGWDVAVFVVAERSDICGDAAVNLALLPEGVKLFFCSGSLSLAGSIPDLSSYALVVDALFGTGLKSRIAGACLDVIDAINASGSPVVSVDIPSGIDGNTGHVQGGAVKADLTVTFAAAKYGHILYPGASYVGELKVADIGIPDEILLQAEGLEFVDAAAAKALLRPRSPDSHKGNFGHALILAGSTGHSGAAALAGGAAVRSGCGLVTIAVPASLNHVLEIKTTEAMTLPLDDSSLGYLGSAALPDFLEGLTGKDAVGIGPGLSRQPDTSNLIKKLVNSVHLPMVIDADGLNAISENLSVLRDRASSVMILTPHPGEMARLTGLTVSEVEADRIGVASQFAVQYRVYLVLKGARTVIATPEGTVAVNGSGNPGMASGGMGDVLTGVIASLLCQGYPSFDACRLGVFLHGYAADLVAADKGQTGLSATDVVENLPYAFKSLVIGDSAARSTSCNS